MTASRLPTRRGFLKTAGAVVALPLLQLQGCADESAAPADPGATQAPRDQAPAVPPTTATAPPSDPAAQPGNLVRLEEGDPTAQALGYRHVAEDVDASRFPRYQPGQACDNCSLYQAHAAQDSGWGGCSIFPGRLVAARGWCNAYVPGA